MLFEGLHFSLMKGFHADDDAAKGFAPKLAKRVHAVEAQAVKVVVAPRRPPMHISARATPRPPSEQSCAVRMRPAAISAERA